VKSSRERGKGLQMTIQPPQMFKLGPGLGERSIAERASNPTI
jgi:hypothetical protein